MAVLRHNLILEFLRSHGSASFAALAEALGVSQETIRRDIKTLTQQGVVQSIRGGAALPEVLQNAAFHYCLLEEAGAKRAIAARAAREVENGDTLLIGGGSTTFYFASALAAHRELTVVTNSVDIARVLVSRGSNTVHIIGGELRPLSGSSIGPRANDALREFNAAKAFFSVGALSARGGYTHDDDGERAFTAALMARARHRYALVDCSKIDRDGVFVVASLAEVETLICETAPSVVMLQALEAAGTQVFIADRD